jgi:CcmD family protein
MTSMRALFRGLIPFVLGLLLMATQAFAQGEGAFRPATPEDLAAGQEHLPATPFVFTAYAVVWLVLVIYVLTLWRRIAKAERDIAEVAAKLEQK